MTSGSAVCSLRAKRNCSTPTARSVEERPGRRKGRSWWPVTSVPASTTWTVTSLRCAAFLGRLRHSWVSLDVRLTIDNDCWVFFCGGGLICFNSVLKALTCTDVYTVIFCGRKVFQILSFGNLCMLHVCT